MLKSIKLIVAYLFFLISNIVFCQTNFSKPTIAIGIVVQDIDKSVDFYSNVLGMTLVKELTIDSVKATKIGFTNNKKIAVKVLKLSDAVNATELKIMSVGNKSIKNKKAHITDSNGIKYLTFYVESMELLLKKIKENNIDTLAETPFDLDNPRKLVLIQDPDRNFIECISLK